MVSAVSAGNFAPVRGTKKPLPSCGCHWVCRKIPKPYPSVVKLGWLRKSRYMEAYSFENHRTKYVFFSASHDWLPKGQSLLLLKSLDPPSQAAGTRTGALQLKWTTSFSKHQPLKEQHENQPFHTVPSSEKYVVKHPNWYRSKWLTFILGGSIGTNSPFLSHGHFCFSVTILGNHPPVSDTPSIA